jgi:DNA-binding NarL/FixJ family response regulator
MKILIVDDHPLFLEGISMVIRQTNSDLEVVDINNGAEALSYLQSHPETALALVDLDMPEMDGFEFLDQLEQLGLLSPVAILSATTNLYDVKRSLELGALGFISKTSDKEEMRKAIASILAGDIYIPAGLEQQLEALIERESMGEEDALRLKAKELGITRRQLQVLSLLAQGLSNKKIADELHLTERTVKAHVSALFDTLNVSNRTECVLEADRLGLTHPETEKQETFTLGGD